MCFCAFGGIPFQPSLLQPESCASRLPEHKDRTYHTLRMLSLVVVGSVDKSVDSRQVLCLLDKGST